MPFGFKLKYIRKSKNIDQQKLGEVLGYTGKVANTTISQYETGSKKPRDKEVYYKLAKELDCSVQMLEGTSFSNIDNLIFPLFWLAIRAGLDIDKDSNGQFIFRFNSNKSGFGSNVEILAQLEDWYQMAEKERSGFITINEMKSWMFKYPYGPNTHYEELLKDVDEPTNYKESYDIFEKVRRQYFDEHYDPESDEHDRLMRELYIRRRTFFREK